MSHGNYDDYTFKWFDFPILLLWAYPMKVIQEMGHGHTIWYLCFYQTISQIYIKQHLNIYIPYDGT